MRTKTAVAASATLCVLTLLTGCGSSAEDTASEPSASESASVEPTEKPTKKRTESADSESPEPAEEVVITIEDFTYSELDPVAPGTEITVENTDTAAHTLTADGEGDFDLTIAPGESGTFTAPGEAGEYPYLCTFHAAMTGTLRVE